ncbi:MAG: B12-binding domain-containing radical SAM protein, partial [Clostridiales bacterium]
MPEIDFQGGKVRMAMAFPDLYEVGMSHLGLRILYEAVNKTQKYTMERVMAPAPDLEALLREEKTPLFSLETNAPIGDFDILGFSIQYELSATNILNILDLGNIPLRSENRNHRHPIIIGGGPCVYNPEPFAPFFDVFLIGEGEDALLEFLELYETMEPQKDDNARQDFLAAVSKIQGFYVPSLYEIGADGGVIPLGDAPQIIKKRYVKD